MSNYVVSCKDSYKKKKNFLIIYFEMIETSYNYYEM